MILKYSGVSNIFVVINPAKIPDNIPMPRVIPKHANYIYA